MAQDPQEWARVNAQCYAATRAAWLRSLPASPRWELLPCLARHAYGTEINLLDAGLRVAAMPWSRARTAIEATIAARLAGGTPRLDAIPQPPTFAQSVETGSCC